MTPYASPRSGYLPPYPARDAASLDGSWISNTEVLLIIKNGFARIYWSRDQYQDYYLKTAPGQLFFKEADTGNVHAFEMAQKEDQLALRDSQRQLILFRKYRGVDQ